MHGHVGSGWRHLWRRSGGEKLSRSGFQDLDADDAQDGSGNEWEGRLMFTNLEMYPYLYELFISTARTVTKNRYIWVRLTTTSLHRNASRVFVEGDNYPKLGPILVHVAVISWCFELRRQVVKWISFHSTTESELLSEEVLKVRSIESSVSGYHDRERRVNQFRKVSLCSPSTGKPWFVCTAAHRKKVYPIMKEK